MLFPDFNSAFYMVKIGVFNEYCVFESAFYLGQTQVTS